MVGAGQRLRRPGAGADARADQPARAASRWRAAPARRAGQLLGAVRLSRIPRRPSAWCGPWGSRPPSPRRTPTCVKKGTTGDLRRTSLRGRTDHRARVRDALHPGDVRGARGQRRPAGQPARSVAGRGRCRRVVGRHGAGRAAQSLRVLEPAGAQNAYKNASGLSFGFRFSECWSGDIAARLVDFGAPRDGCSDPGAFPGQGVRARPEATACSTSTTCFLANATTSTSRPWPIRTTAWCSRRSDGNILAVPLRRGDRLYTGDHAWRRETALQVALS